MSLVVDDQTCALRERLLADSAVPVAEPALELRRAGASALGRDRKLLVSVTG